ncbi:MAG: ATP-binding cassette domain-containing protein [Anaerolineae bacterium]
MPQETAIVVEHVSKTYGNFRAVNDLSFEVYNGEIFAMLGPNGAGKSTTIRMILDIIKPDSGTIRVLGGPLTDAKKDNIGYLPEERGLYRDVKVIDMMVYLGTLKGMSAKAARQRAAALLERLELGDKAESKVKEFSKGMQQKVQFAVTIMHNPDLIIVDEPFSGLDPVNTRLIKDILLDLRDQGKAIVMSSHEMYQVEEMGDRLLMINRGQMALYGPVDEVRNRYAQHAVIVEGQGDFNRVPGVARVDAANNRRNALTLFMHDGVNANDVLGAIAADPTVTVNRFELAVPSLNEIFIAVAGETPEEAEAARAQEHKEAVNV